MNINNRRFEQRELTVQGFVDVAESVGEVDPRIHDRQGDEILECRHTEEDEESGQTQLDSAPTDSL